MNVRDWTRHEKVFKARRAGLTLREAGELIGVSKERAREMEAKTIKAIHTGVALSENKLTEREIAIGRRIWPKLDWPGK